MAEPKGGPVKPPTLDLKPRQVSTSRSDKSGTSKPGVKNATPAGSQQSKAANPSAKKPASDTSQNARNGTRKSANTRPSATPSSTQTSATLNPKSWMTPTLAAIFGALGGAALSLILVIPLIMSGIFQPDTQSQTRAQIKTLEENLGATQNLSNQNLTGFSGLNDEISVLRQDMAGQNTTVQNQLAQLAQAQQELLARQTVQETALGEQITSLTTQIETANAIELPPTPTPFDPAPLLQQISDLDAKLDAIAAGASNEDAQKLSADIAQMQNQLGAVQIQLDQQVESWSTQFAQLSENLDGQKQRFETINTLIAQNSDQLKQQDLSLSGLSLNTSELMQTTSQLQQTVQEIADAAQTTEPGNVQGEQVSATPVQIQQIPFALMSIEIALNNGQPFLYQLESLATQTTNLETTPELLHAAADGLAIPDEIAAEFDRLIPVVLSARPTNPNASYLDRIGDSIKSILGLRATGLENGDEFENLLNQSLAAIKVSDFSKAQTLLDNLPAPMHANLGDLNQQIALHANIQSLMASVSETQLENTPPTPPAPQPEPEPEPEPTQPTPEQQPTPVSDEVSQ